MKKIALPLIVRKSRWRSAGVLLGSAITVGISTRAMVVREPTLVTWVVIVMFGGIAWVCLGQLLDSKPRLTISETGICVAHWNVGLILWNDLSEAFLKADRGAEYICLTLRDPGSFLPRMNRIARAFNASTRQTGFSDFTLKPADMGLDTNLVFELVREQINLAKTRPKPPESSSRYPLG